MRRRKSAAHLSANVSRHLTSVEGGVGEPVAGASVDVHVPLDASIGNVSLERCSLLGRGKGIVAAEVDENLAH